MIDMPNSEITQDNIINIEESLSNSRTKTITVVTDIAKSQKTACGAVLGGVLGAVVGGLVGMTQTVDYGPGGYSGNGFTEVVVTIPANLITNPSATLTAGAAGAGIGLIAGIAIGSGIGCFVAGKKSIKHWNESIRNQSNQEVGSSLERKEMITNPISLSV